MIWIAHRYPRGLPYSIGGVLVLAGLYTLFTQNGSLGVVLKEG